MTLSLPARRQPELPLAHREGPMPPRQLRGTFRGGVKGSGKCVGLGLRVSSLYSAIMSFVTLGKSLSLSGPHSVFLLVTN